MDREEPRDNELERELDSLYRKVAGLDQPAEDRQKPIETRSGQRRWRRFRTVGLGWGLAFALFFLGMLGFLREWSRSPVDTAVIALTAEETKDHSAASAPVRGGKGRADGKDTRYRSGPIPKTKGKHALTFLEDVRKKAPDVSMETVSIAGRGVWHRILLGNFSTAEEAAEYQKQR